MNSGRVTSLSGIIIDKIREEGPLSFRDYMEMCLYYPDLGYYTSSKIKIGESGDFYTSSSLTPAFGIMIGRQMEEMWQNMGCVPFTIVEYGAGTGLLCRDILDHLRHNQAMYQDLRYCIIEKSQAMQATEKMHLKEKVSWYDSIADIGEIHGCILSNELLDNFAVHQVVVIKDELHEVFVDHEYDRFIEILRPASEPLKNYMKELDLCFEEGFRTEINIQATEWIVEVAQALSSGYVLTIDYGYPSSELYQNYRRTGTLVCYHSHHVNTDPYINIGAQDITSHVNFSALCHWGLHNGLSCCGLTDQAHFLTGLGLRTHLKKLTGNEYRPSDYVQEMFLKTVLLKDMGSKFKILIQSKALPPALLSGLKIE